MSKKVLPLIALLLSAALFSCKKESDEQYQDEKTRGYFPLALGRYVTYDVDSLIYNDFDCKIDTQKYQMRYNIMDTFRDNSLRLSYLINTQIRRADTLPWRSGEVFYATPTATGLEVMQSNLRFLKLAFPVAHGKTWMGNSMIPAQDQDYQYLNDWTYRYQDFQRAFNTGKVEFQNTVTVMQQDEKQNDPETMPTAYAFRTYGKEVYAYDIGMVYKELTHWTYDPGTSQCRKGYSVIMRAVDFGSGR